jgi:hypothetical protein
MIGATSLANVGEVEGAGELADWPNDNAADRRRTGANKRRPFISRLLREKMQINREYISETSRIRDNFW